MLGWEEAGRGEGESEKEGKKRREREKRVSGRKGGSPVSKGKGQKGEREGERRGKVG